MTAAIYRKEYLKTEREIAREIKQGPPQNDSEW